MGNLHAIYRLSLKALSTAKQEGTRHTTDYGQIHGLIMLRFGSVLA